MLTELHKEIVALRNQVVDLRKEILILTTPKAISDKWVPRSLVMDFMDYQNTQMAEFEKTDGIVVSQVGRRKFILRDSLEKLIDKNIVRKDTLVKA